ITNILLKSMQSEMKPEHGKPVKEPKNSLADIRRAKTLLNWEPRMSLENGIRETLSTSCHETQVIG
ncbi:MAG TPA: hypothetical protein VJA22_01360, partial [Patescibacteria group bacterium]|nr:hypothetical protein [Patescibacteria group bacterium]